MHPHAADAARANCCAELLGKGDEATDALVDANPEDLTPEGCEKIAEKLGLDMDRFRACVKDPATDARIKADSEMFKASAGHGLPMLYIGETRLVGEQDHDTLKAAIDDELRRL
jgi:predicted DsbA family dithiol-disulfide isomerase